MPVGDIHKNAQLVINEMTGTKPVIFRLLFMPHTQCPEISLLIKVQRCGILTFCQSESRVVLPFERGASSNIQQNLKHRYSLT